MPTIEKANDLLVCGETAMVIFTKGDRFRIHEDASGSSGNWIIRANKRVDKVIVYKRSRGVANPINEIYCGQFVSLVLSDMTPDRRR